jgi:hypothetical protein
MFYVNVIEKEGGFVENMCAQRLTESTQVIKYLKIKHEAPSANNFACINI